MVSAKVLPISFIILVAAVIAGIFLNYKLLALLKKRHFEKWKELGSPSLVINNSIKTNFAILAFLKNKEYLKMNDNKLSQISKLIWYYSITYIFFFGLVVITFLLNLKQ